MKDSINDGIQPGGMNESKGCDCEGNCCPPKKRTILPKLIFSIVLLAALGIILFKSFNPSTSSPSTSRHVIQGQDSPASVDSTKSSCCDTAKTSCCPK